MSRETYGLTSSGVITEEVRSFLTRFRENVNRGNAKLLYQSYNAFQSITEKIYQVSTWPTDSDVIRDLRIKNIGDKKTKIFLYLYRELYYRHAFNKCDISFKTMHDSFQNYINLFNTLLDFYDANKKFAEIPNVWLWDMINSFVSQFQYYHHWRSDSKDDYANMQNLQSKKWNVADVLRYLHYFVSAAKIQIKYNEPPNDSKESKAKTPTIMMQMLGFFSLIGLCRIHNILGDYRTAIDVMNPVDLKAKSAITKLASCGISAHYYLSFAYCMTRRFPDAHMMLVTLLRNPRYNKEDGGRFAFTDKDDKKGKESKKNEAANDQELSDKDRYHKQHLSNECMISKAWAMLGIAQTQSPTKLDEAIGSELRDECGVELDDINDNNSSDERRKEAYFKLFSTAAPDFINIFDLFDKKERNLAKIGNNELLNKQFDAFMRLTHKGHDMVKVKNEIRLFRVIPIEKLAKAMGYDEDEIGKLNRELIRLKWKMKQNQKIDSWGNSKDEFSFYIKDDCVYVQELQNSELWQYSDFFIRNIQTVTDWIDNDPLL